MAELKPCPFCGGQAKIMRRRCAHTTTPTVIRDEFCAGCEACGVWLGYCTSKIWLDDDGQLHVDYNGAESAAEVWNGRADNG